MVRVIDKMVVHRLGSLEQAFELDLSLTTQHVGMTIKSIAHG